MAFCRGCMTDGASHPGQLCPTCMLREEQAEANRLTRERDNREQNAARAEAQRQQKIKNQIIYDSLDAEGKAAWDAEELLRMNKEDRLHQIKASFAVLTFPPLFWFFGFFFGGILDFIGVIDDWGVWANWGFWIGVVLVPICLILIIKKW